MKAFLLKSLFAAALLATLTSCDKPRIQMPESSNEPAGSPEPVATQVPSTPLPSPTPTEQSPSAAEKKKAPDGILYVTKRATITTADGIVGVPVGAEVSILERLSDGSITVGYRGHKLTLPAEQLTDDMELAGTLSRPAVRPNSSNASVALTPEDKNKAAETAAKLEAQRQANVRETRAKQLEASVALAEKDIATLKEQIEKSVRMGNRDRTVYQGGVVYGDNIENRARRQQIEKLQAQISAWRNEIASLRR